MDQTKRLAEMGVHTADILIPKKGIDLKKWCVVACDQYTSEKQYWKDVDSYVGSAPSTLRLIYPEVYLNDNDKESRITDIDRTMIAYGKEGLFKTYPNCFFLVHRTTENHRERWGLMVALDLEKYDYSKESRSLIRATEGTILSRIPPRKEIRKNATLEIPHIMVLIDDKKKAVIEPLIAKLSSLEKVYDTPLMAHGGSLQAYCVQADEDIKSVADGIAAISALLDKRNPLLFAMGDGNHSLATAKSCWEDIKKGLSQEERENHPARFALVELENIHQEGLVFEPIHRLLFNISYSDFLLSVRKQSGLVSVEDIGSLAQAQKLINEKGSQKFAYLDKDGWKLFSLENPSSSIAAGTIQSVIDSLLENGETEVDYVHGTHIVEEKGKLDGNCGILLPDVDKNSFFDTIIRDSALPRKTFSMGEAAEKRFYMEARKITL